MRRRIYHATGNLIEILNSEKVVANIIGIDDCIFEQVKRRYDALIQYANERAKILRLMEPGFESSAREIVSENLRKCKTAEEIADDYYANIHLDTEKTIFATIGKGWDYRELLRNLNVWCFYSQQEAVNYVRRIQQPKKRTQNFVRGVLGFNVPTRLIRSNRKMNPLVLKEIPFHPYLEEIMVEAENEMITREALKNKDRFSLKLIN